MDILNKRRQVVDLRQPQSPAVDKKISSESLDNELKSDNSNQNFNDNSLNTKSIPADNFSNAQNPKYTGSVGTDEYHSGGLSVINHWVKNENVNKITNFITKKRTKKQGLFLKQHSQKYNIIGSILLIILVLGLFIFTKLTSIDIFFWAFFISMFYWHIDSRVSIGGALVGLVAVMILTILGNWKLFTNAQNWSETVAVWVYFFLVIGVVKQIWEYKIEEN